MPVPQEIKGGQPKGQARLERGPRSLRPLLDMTDAGQLRQHPLYPPPGMPAAAGPEFEMRGIPGRGREAGSAQDEPLCLTSFPPGREGSLRRGGPGALPGDDPAQGSEPQAEVAADKPARRGVPLAPNLRGTAPCAQGRAPCAPLAVYPPHDRGGGPEGLGPRARKGQEPPEPGPRGPRGK